MALYPLSRRNGETRLDIKEAGSKMNLTKKLKESLAATKGGKRKKRPTTAFLAEGIEVEITKNGDIILPKKLAECADLLYRCREKRLEVQHVAERMEELEGLLKDHFRKELPAQKNKASGIAGSVARVQLEPKSIPQVADWPTFYKYVAKNNAFEMLQRRLNEAAIKERWE